MPSHITGFFYPVVGAKEPLLQGSLGAGVCMEMGMWTEAEFREGGPSGVEVWLDGRPCPEMGVSRAVGLRLLEVSGRSGRLAIRHRSEAPIGAGFGMSGAAALGAAFSANEALGLGWEPLRLAQLAHEAEVEQRTGLGTVIAEYHGGLEVRVRPGAPGIGSLVKVRLDGPYYVLALYNGPMSTREMLSRADLMGELKALGPLLLRRMLAEPSAQNFMRLSHEFSLALSPVPPHIKRDLLRLRKEGLLMAMAMFGHTYFALLREEELEEARAKALRLVSARRLFVSRVDERGLEGELALVHTA